MREIYRPKNGFTLIELSIVLVIIGLVVGGVLAGNDLIRASRIRATISQLEQFNTAVTAFRGKYGGLPGDLPNLDNFGLLPSGSTQTLRGGNGDGTIGYFAAGNNQNRDIEYMLFWQSLYNSGLLAGDGKCLMADPGNFTLWQTIGYCSPLSKISGSPQRPPYSAMGFFRVYQFPDSHYFQLVSGGSQSQQTIPVCGGANTIQYLCNALTPSDAYAIDAKIDDGMPVLGKVRAFDGSAFNLNGGVAGAAATFNNATQGASGTSKCVDSGTSPLAYNIANDDMYRCALNIKAVF